MELKTLRIIGELTGVVKNDRVNYIWMGYYELRRNAIIFLIDHFRVKYPSRSIENSDLIYETWQRSKFTKLEM